MWRGFAFLALFALGLCVTFATDGHHGFALAWGIITVAWGAVAGLLWRSHLRAG